MIRERAGRVLAERAGIMPAAHLLAAALCAGFALALLVRTPAPLVALAAAASALFGLAGGRRRSAFLGGALALAGLWWGSVRLDALDSSMLEAEIGRAALAQVEVTAPCAEASSRSAFRCGSFASDG